MAVSRYHEDIEGSLGSSLPGQRKQKSPVYIGLIIFIYLLLLLLLLLYFLIIYETPRKKKGGRPAIISLDCSLHQVISCSRCSELKRSENARSLSQLHSCLHFLYLPTTEIKFNYLSRRMSSLSSLIISCQIRSSPSDDRNIHISVRILKTDHTRVKVKRRLNHQGK